MSVADETQARPTLTVVVASRGDRTRLAGCLAALREQAAAHGAEVVVAHAGIVDNALSRARGVRVVQCAAGATLTELRAAGMRAAGGDIVALLNDDDVPAADWLPQLVNRYGPGAQG